MEWMIGQMFHHKTASISARVIDVRNEIVTYLGHVGMCNVDPSVFATEYEPCPLLRRTTPPNLAARG